MEALQTLAVKKFITSKLLNICVCVCVCVCVTTKKKWEYRTDKTITNHIRI